MAELVRSADALPKTNTDHIQLLLITDIWFSCCQYQIPDALSLREGYETRKQFLQQGFCKITLTVESKVEHGLRPTITSTKTNAQMTTFLPAGLRCFDDNWPRSPGLINNGQRTPMQVSGNVFKPDSRIFVLTISKGQLILSFNKWHWPFEGKIKVIAPLLSVSDTSDLMRWGLGHEQHLQISLWKTCHAVRDITLSFYDAEQVDRFFESSLVVLI
jgi:hypothetical protein